MGYDHADPEYAGTLHHVELSTADLPSSLGFWNWFLAELGYEVKNDWEGGRSWIRGPTYIVLKQADEGHPFNRHESGLNHLAFHAKSREQVDQLTESIRKRDGSTVLYEEQHPYAGGYYALYCEDPEGVKVELVGPE
ncbi:VOC family protein [Halovenus rubra]|uniref:VOC family protein n=2 Tax=Halovenus rubra TaxID=869890 RepID=A0ACC7E692_9EURY|nr:VOC family protein [Halovenus rubra]